MNLSVLKQTSSCNSPPVFTRLLTKRSMVLACVLHVLGILHLAVCQLTVKRERSPSSSAPEREEDVSCQWEPGGEPEKQRSSVYCPTPRGDIHTRDVVS
ncbi:hypothetical protein RRG08_045184 [Elysia crispata]|uniref:Uncharacterized protein n=1 Tax=Elysia crispata TaxID=231223 RepID=A0AAE1DWY9_9GAST|nr:hypothetical protein RRG08_045184 [Elysia crispata]